MRIHWSQYILAAGLAATAIVGCDPANINVFMTNKTDKDIFVEFPMDQTGSHVKVPAHQRVQVMENVFEGAHEAVIIDAQTRKTIAKPNYGNERPNGTTLEITYPR